MSKSIDRIKTILFFIKEIQFPSMERIIEKLIDTGYDASERTIQRDIKSIREMLLIEVKFDRTKNGYFIDEESQKTYEEWLSFFELYQTAKVINETLLRSADGIDYIDFDRNKQLINEQILSDLLNATYNKKSIQIKYHSFWRDETNEYDFQPYLIKQYQNRWYVFGTINKNEFRTFGLDRITKIIHTNETFKPINKKPKTFFDDIIGMIYSTSEVQQVVLSFTPHQGKYIKTQPLHHSQRILIDNEEELRIQLNIRMNYELEEQILKQGEKVTVIEPLALKEHIKNRILKSLENYK
jgi:predicted DNA-binding transcriptional regulator YafY